MKISTWRFTVLLALLTASPAYAQSSAGLHQVTPAQQLSLEQLDQLIEAAEAEAAVKLAVEMIDEADGRLVSTSLILGFQEPPASVESFVPLEVIIHDRLLQASTQRPAVLESYRNTYDAHASTAFEEASANRSIEEIERFLRRYFASSYGDDALLRLADLALERGWVLRARDALRRIDPRWQPHQQAAVAGSPVPAVDWVTMLDRVNAEALPALAAEMETRRGRPLGSYQGSDLPQTDVAARLVYCQLLSGNRDAAEKLAAIAAIWFPEHQVRIAGRSGEVSEMMDWLMEQAGPWPSHATAFTHPQVANWSTVGGHSQRSATASGSLQHFGDVPRWVADIAVLPSEIDLRLPAQAERAGSDQKALSVPIIHEGRVFLSTANGIAGWDLKSGEAWPPGLGDDLMFRAAADAIDAETLRLPVDTMPRFTLTADGSHLAGRFGNVVTGKPQALLQQPSGSQICLLDLDAEGALLDGYPLDPPANSEFEGTPVLVGSRLFVGASRRDEATKQSRVLCYDRLSGQRLWASPPLSLLRQPASREVGNISHALVTHCEGLIYFQSHQGTVAAVEGSSGRLRWMVRYPREELAESPFETQRFAEGKRLSPVAITGSHAVICAADLDRVVVVDPIDGRLLWATPPGLGDDIDQVLGAADGRLIMAGHRVYWFDVSSGRLAGVFPNAVTRQAGGGIAQPAGAGKGVMTEQHIFWPTREKVLVFDTELATIEGRSQPRLLDQIDLRPAGIVGGHLAVGGRFLVNAGPRHLAVFEGRLQLSDRSMKLME